MAFFERGNIRIHYEEVGTGTPLLIIPGGGLNSSFKFFSTLSPFDAVETFKDSYRCICMDLRNANDGASTGPLEIDRPWDAFADDQLALMDHLGIDKFLVLGFCIGGPFIWNLLKRAPERITAAVMAQPSGCRPEIPLLGYTNNLAKWGPDLVARRPEITMDMIDRFLTNMYVNHADFVFTVDRDFVRQCQTPILVLPDDSPPHPLVVAMEVVKLAPNAESSIYPWKDPKSLIPQGIAHIRKFLAEHDH